MHNISVSFSRLFVFILVLFGSWYGSKILEKDQQNTPIPTPELVKFQLEIPKFSLFKTNPNPEIEFSQTDKPIEDLEVQEAIPTWNRVVIQTNGTNRKYGNLIAIQPKFFFSDFSNETTIAKRLKEIMEQGKVNSLYDRKTIVVMPEHIGSGLVFLDEKQNTFKSMSFNALIQFLNNKYKSELSSISSNSKISRNDIDKVFRLKAQRMSEAYVSLFSKLSKEYSVPIFAGSIILPGPKISNGKISIDTTAPLYNIAVVFGADGRVMEPLVKKTILSEEESLILEKGDVNQNRVWIVPGWKVGVFLGEEVFSEVLFDKLKSRPLDGIVVAGFSNPLGSPKALSRFLPEPVNLDNETEIWLRYGALKYIQNTKAQDLVQAFASFSVWGQNTRAQSFNVRDFLNQDRANSESPTIMNLYF